MTAQEELDLIVADLPTISQNKNYWMIRTNGGEYFQTFLDNNFVGIDYDAIPYSIIDGAKKEYPNPPDFLAALKAIVKEAYPEEKQPGLIAGQMSKFIYEARRGDIVIIPSTGSSQIAIGEITETPVFFATEAEFEKTQFDGIFRKKVKWLRTFSREQLDPYLYRVLFAHQALSNLNSYAEYIERSLHSFFIKDGEAHLVLEIETEEEVHAKDLFYLNAGYLEELDRLSEHFELGVSSSQLEVKIALNSPGKIHFKATSWKAIALLGIVTVCIVGGGLKVNTGSFQFDLSTDGLIKKMIDYSNNAQDRAMQQQMFEQYKDSLKVKTPSELVELLQQASVNKINPHQTGN